MNKMTTFKDAAVVARQPTKPCHDCPWARAAITNWLGPFDAHGWLALAHGEGRADCHATKGEAGETWECAGLAIYRRNVTKVTINNVGLQVEADTELVFESPRQFAEHHGEEFSAAKLVTKRWSEP